MAKYRSQNHMLLLYPDNEEHMKAYNIIQKSYDYISILHDRDVTKDGELKKAHLHIIIRCKNSRWSSAICKELGITDNYIEEIKNLNNAMLYLLHYKDPDKAQYDIEETQGRLKQRLHEILNNVDKGEGEKVGELIIFIKNYEGHLSVTDFAIYCAQNGYWAEFRRSGAIFCRIIEEHNFKYQNKNIKRD